MNISHRKTTNSMLTDARQAQSKAIPWQFSLGSLLGAVTLLGLWLTLLRVSSMLFLLAPVVVGYGWWFRSWFRRADVTLGECLAFLISLSLIGSAIGFFLE